MASRDTITISAVAFDIDGTLYPNGRMFRASASLVLRHIRLFHAFGRARVAARTMRPIDDLAATTAALTADRLGISVERADAAIRDIIYRRWEATLRRVKPFRGARELLVWLRERGIKTGAMSDFPVVGKLRTLGLDGLWDTAFSSEETEYLKPNPEPFARLVEELGEEPERILYVGNSARYDVAGARNAGLRTAYITNRRSKHADVADCVFSRYTELQAWLAPRLTEEAVRRDLDRF